MSDRKQAPVEVINDYLVSTPASYVVMLKLDPSKPFVQNGVDGIAPYYGSGNSTSNVVLLGSLSVNDNAKVFIPNAPKSTGTPTPGWWLPVGTDVSTLPSIIYRVVLAESATKHTFVKSLPNGGVLTSLDDVSITPSDRTWSEAQDSVGVTTF